MFLERAIGDALILGKNLFFKDGKSVGLHIEPGPNGGIVQLDDTTVLDKALKILDELNINYQEEKWEEQLAIELF